MITTLLWHNKLRWSTLCKSQYHFLKYVLCNLDGWLLMQLSVFSWSTKLQQLHLISLLQLLDV